MAPEHYERVVGRSKQNGTNTLISEHSLYELIFTNQSVFSESELYRDAVFACI